MLKQIAFLSSVLISALSANAQTTILDQEFQHGIPASWTTVKSDSYIEHEQQFLGQPAWIAISDPFNPTDTIALQLLILQFLKKQAVG